MLRMIFSVSALLLVLYLLMELAGSQLKLLSRSPASAAAAASSVPGAALPPNAAGAAAQRIVDAVQQGVAQRASEPVP